MPSHAYIQVGIFASIIPQLYQMPRSIIWNYRDLNFEWLAAVMITSDEVALSQEGEDTGE